MKSSISLTARLKSWRAIAALKATTFAAFGLIYASPANAQSAQQTTAPSSSVVGDFNNVIQVPNQNNAQSSNVNRPVFNNIYPLNTPPNAEDDFGFNLSVSYSDDVIVSAGVVYQPGRSRAHQARMRQLAEQTDLLAAQKKIAEAELQLLQMQIEEAKQKLQSL